MDEFVKLDRPSLQWLIPGLIPKPSWILLLGEPKAGKSTFALQLALCVAQGKPFFPGVPCRQGRTLFFQFDTSELVWRKRILDIQKAGGSISGPSLVVHPEDDKKPVNLLDIATQNWMKEAIALAEPALIVVDVLREVHSGDENDSSSMKLAGDVLYGLTRNSATVILHHSKKPFEGQPMDPIQASRGSTYITGKADAVWLISGQQLVVVPRFAGRRVYQMRRGAEAEGGLWSFVSSYSPDDSIDAMIKRGDVGYDTKTHTYTKLSTGEPLAKHS